MSADRFPSVAEAADFADGFVTGALSVCDGRTAEATPELMIAWRKGYEAGKAAVLGALTEFCSSPIGGGS